MFVSSLPEYYILYKLPIRVPTKVQSTTILVFCEKMKQFMETNPLSPFFHLLSPSLTFFHPSLTLFHPPIIKINNLTI